MCSYYDNYYSYDDYLDEQVLTLGGDYMTRREIDEEKARRRQRERDRERGIIHYGGDDGDM